LQSIKLGDFILIDPHFVTGDLFIVAMAHQVVCAGLSALKFHFFCQNFPAVSLFLQYIVRNFNE